MNRHTIVLTLVLTLCCQAAVAEEPVLHMYNWVEYIGPDTLADFKAQTGITVVYDVYDSNDVLQGKLLAGNSGYDIVVPTNGVLARLIAAGVFMPLDKARLPNLFHMDPELMKKVATSDPGNRYGVPYLWGTTGLGINKQLVAKALGPDAPLDSWELVFNPEYLTKLKDCGVSFLDAYDELFPAVLNYLKLDPGSIDPNLFRDRVVPVLEAVHPYVTYYHSSKYIGDLANGDICLAIGWSGDVLQASARAKEAGQPFEITYTIPREGTLIWIDMLAVPVDAPHPENAHKFINFLMEPQNIAAVSNEVRYPNGNRDANALVDPAMLADPRIYPGDALRARSYTLPAYPARVDRQGLRLWTRIKTGR